MDVDVFEHGWEHLPDHKSLNSSSSREGSSTTLSPSLQSYLDVNSNNHPSWPSSSAFSPYQQQNPTCIRRADIARIARRHGPSWARKRGSGGSLHRGATSLGPPSAHAAPGPYSRSISDGRAGVDPNTYLGRAVPLSAQFKDILERGWDGRMALGRRTGGERRLLAAHLSTSASAPCFEEKPHQYLAAPKSWDNPRMRVNTRSAGSSRSRGPLILRDTSFPDPDDLLGRGADQTGGAFSIRSGGQMHIRRPRTAPVLHPPRLSPSGRGGRSRALPRAPNGPDPGTMGLQSTGGREGFDGLSRSGSTADHAPPELSRSLSPPPKMGGAQTTNIHLPPFTSYSFGPSRESTAEETTTGRQQPRFVTVRALSLLPCGSIGQEVASVGMSPFDSVRSLRAAISTDIDRNNRSTIDAHHDGGGGGGAWGSSPAFLFSYADGVPIDRGQEGRLSVQDIAIASSSSSSRATNNADDPRGGEGGRGRRSAEACVFLRACSYQSSELETGDGGSVLEGGVLSRWGSLQGGGSCGNEAFPLDDSAGSPEHLRPIGAGSLSNSPVRNAMSSFHGGSEEVHWSVDGHEETGLLNLGGGGGGGGGLTRGTVVNVESPQRSSSQRRRRISVSFDESKAARRQRILEQVERLAAAKATTIAKVCRGHQARIAFRGRLDRHRKALTIQLCSRRWSAKLELQLRARRRDGAVKMQALVRSYASRRRLSLRRDCDHQAAAATRIQSNARKMAARREFESRWRMRRAVVVLQCWARLKAAKKRASSQAQRSTTPGVTIPANPASVATTVEKQEPSVTDKPSPDEILSTEATTRAMPRFAQGPPADAEEGEGPVADAPDEGVVLAAEAAAHEVDPSAQGSQAETFMAAAAAEEGEVLQKGATPGKERSAAVMEPFDTVAVGAEEPDVDGAGRDNTEPERVTPEDTGAVNNIEPENVSPKDVGAANAILPLAAEERAVSSDGGNLSDDAAPTTECTPFTAHEKAPPDEEEGAAVVGSPAAAVPDGDVPDVVGESRIQQGVDNSGFVAPEEEPASVADAMLTDSVRPDHDAMSIGPCESTQERVIETIAVKQITPATVGETGVHQLAMEGDDASTVEKPTTDAVEVSVPVLKVEEGVDLAVASDVGGPAGEIPVRLDGEDEGLQGVADGSESRSVKALTPEEGGHDPMTGPFKDAVLGSPSISDEGCGLEANDFLEVPADEISGGDDALQPAADGDESLREKSLTRDESKEVDVDPVLGGPSLSAAEVPRMTHDSDDARPISVATQDICTTAIEDSAPSGTPNDGSTGDVGCLNLEPEHETSTANINLDSPSLGDPTPSAAGIVTAAKDMDAAQFTPEIKQDSPATSAKDEARMDASTLEKVAAGDAITTADKPFVIPTSDDRPVSAIETVEDAEDTGVSQPIPAATQETLAAAIEYFSPINAKDTVLVDGSVLEEVAPDNAIVTAEEKIVVPASSDDPPWSTAEVVGDAGDAGSSQPTSAALEERTVTEVKDNTPADVQDGTSGEQPDPESASPVATEGATSPSPVFCGTTESMIMVADADVDVSNPVAGDETLVVTTEDRAPEVVPGGASACEPVPIAPVQEHTTPATEEFAADPVSDDPTTSATEAQTMEAADTSQLTTVNTEDTLVFATEDNVHSAVRDGGSGGELAPIISSPERTTPEAEGSISLVESGDPTSAVGETLGTVEAAEFAKPTYLASKEELVAEIDVSTATNTKDQATADGPASMTPAPENMTAGAELPVTVPVTNDISLAGTDISRTVEDAGAEQSTPIAEEEVQLAANQMSASSATDGALPEQPTLETAAPEGSEMVSEEKVDTSGTIDPILSAAEAPEVVENIDVEQSSVLGAQEVLASAVVNHVSTVSLEEESADKPAHTTSPLEHITPTAERFDAVSVTDEPPLGLTETVGMSKEEAEFSEATPVTGEETMMATKQLSTTTDAATDGVSAEQSALETTSLEFGSTIAEEKVAISATGDLGVSATETLVMENNADGEQPSPAGTGEVLEGEVNTHAIVPDQALDDEPTHLSRSLAYVTPAAEESIAVAVTGDPPPLVAAETLGMEEDADIEEPTPMAGEDTPSLVVEDSIPRDVPVDWPAEEPSSIVPALERAASPSEDSVAVPVSEELESSVAETLRVEEVAGFDIPPPVAGEEALVASVEAMDGASSASEHATILAGEKAAVPTLGDPSPPVGGEFGVVNDMGGTQSNPVGAEETISSAIEADPPIVPSDDASAAEPDYSLPALVDVAAVAKEPVAVSVADESTSLVKKSPGQAEETDIEHPTPGAAEERETLPSAVEKNASAIVLNLVSADESSLEAAAPEFVTSVAEEFVTVSVLGDRSLSIAEGPEMEGGVDVAQPNHVDAEEVVAGTVKVGTSKVVVDDELIPVTPSPKDAASAATGSIAVPVTDGPSLTAKDTLDMVGDTGIGQPNRVAEEETLVTTMQPGALTDAADATLIEQPGLEIATPEHVTNTSDEQVTVPGTNDSCLPATEKLDKGEDAGAGESTPLAEEIMVASEANAVDDVSTEQPPVEKPALEHSTNTAEEHADALATSEPEFPDTEALGMTEDAGVEQPIPVVREENVVAATEQTSLLVDPDSVLTEQPASVTSAAAPEAEEPVPDPVTDNPVLPEAATSGMEEGSDIEKSTSATQEATPVASVEASVADSATGGLSAERSGSDTAVVDHTATTSGARTDPPATNDPLSSATEDLGATRDVDTERPTPVGAEETLAGAIEETAPTFVSGEESADEPASVAAPSEGIPWEAEDSIVVPIVDGPSSPAKDNVKNAESLEVDQSIAVPEQEMLGATMEQSPATVVSDGALGGDISSATSSPMDGAPAELGASSAEAPSVATPITGDPTLSATGISEVEDNADVKEPTPVAGESALVVSIEDSSAPAIVLEETLAEQNASGVGASNDVVMSVDQPVAVPVTGDPSLSVEEVLVLADDDGVQNPTPAATGETLVTAVEDSGTSTEKAVSKYSAPNNDASLAKDSVAGPVVDEHILSTAQDLGQAAGEEAAQPAPAASEEAPGATTQDCDPTNVLNAVCTEDPDSAAARAPEHEVSAGEETIDNPVPNGFTSPACEAVGVAESTEVAQSTDEAVKELPGAVTGDIASAAVVDAALATEDGSMTAAPTLVAPAAAEETVQVSVSGGSTPSVEALRTSEGAEVEKHAALAEEENLVAETDTADSLCARDEAVTEDPGFTGNADEAERPATDDCLAGQEVGNYTSSIGEPPIVTAEDAVEAPAENASVAMTEDTEAQHGAAETAESQRATATTLEAVAAGAPAMTEGNEGGNDHPVAGEQTSITTIEDSAHLVAPGAPMPEEITLGSAAQMEDVPEVGEPLVLVLAVDGGAELSADASLAATSSNREADEAIAGNCEAHSADALSMEVAEEPSAPVDDTEVKRRISGTGGQAPEDSVDATDTTIAADEATARSLSSTTSPEVQAGSTSTGLLASPVTDDPTVPVFEESSLTADGAIEKPAEILPASMTEDSEAQQIVDGSVERDTAEVFAPGATKEVLGTVADTQIELPQLVADEETTCIEDERTAQTLVHDDVAAENPAPMAHVEDKATAGEPILETPAAEDPFVDDILGDPALCVDETSSPVVDDAVDGSADKASVEVVKEVEAHEASAHTTEDRLDKASTSKDSHQLSLAADDSQIEESIPVGEGGVSDTMPQTVSVDRAATAESGFTTATAVEASPVAKEPVINAVLGGPTVSTDDPPTLILDACGDASVDKPSVASMEEDNIQEAVTGSTQDTLGEVLTVKEEEKSQALEESRTQLVSDGPTPSGDAASTLAVDPSINMVVNTSTMTANEEDELPQVTADSAEGRSVEVATPEVAVDIAPEEFSTPAQEEVVPVAEELPADEAVANDAPATAGDTENEMSYPVNGEEAKVAVTENVVSTIQGGSITEEPVPVSDIPQEEAPGETQPVSDGPTPSVDAASTLTVDASIDMVVDTPAMVASEEGELSQAAADSAEGGSVEVVAPEEAVDIAPEELSTPAQEDVVPVAEELPADEVVANDAPGTAGDTENEMSYPVNGEDATVAVAENVVSIIQGGSITEEPALVSDIPQEEAPGETQPVSDGPTPSVDAASTLTVDAPIDMAVNTSTMEAHEEGDTSQAAADSGEGGSVGVTTPEVAVDVAPEELSPPAQEEVVPVVEELPADEAVANDAPGTPGDTENEMSYPVNEEEATVAATENVVSAIQGGSITKEPASVSDIPQEEASGETHPVSDGPTPSVDAASTLTVDAPIDMAVNTSTMEAHEEGDTSQPAADSAEGGSVGVTTPEVAVDVAPEELSPPAQEEVVPVVEELPADEAVANDAPATAGDTESKMSYPVHGEETTVAATENVTSTIQGGSITEEPASVSDIPQEEASGETQPVSDGPTPSVDAASTLAVNAPIDMAVNTSTMEAREEGDISQPAADSAEGGSVEVVTPEVAVEVDPEVFSTPAQEEVAPVAVELPADEVVVNDAPATAGDTESEMSYPVHGEETTVAATENVTSTIQGGSITEEPASVSDIPQEEASGETQPVSDGPTPSVDAASTFAVDAPIDMIANTSTMEAREEGDTSQPAADSAEGRSVEVITPKVAVKIASEILSTPAQEEVVPVVEELPADEVVVNDAPATAGDTESEMSYPVHGEETTVAATENVASTIQGGSITEEPASVSDIPQEEASGETQPVSDGPTPSGDAASTFAVDAPIDMAVNTSTMEAREEGDISQPAADSAEGRSVDVTTPEVAVEIAPEIFSTPAQEEVVPVAEELPADEVVANDAPGTTGDTENKMSYPVGGEESTVAATENVVLTIQSGSITEEPASVSDIPQEEALEETQPVSDGPTPSGNAASTLTVHAPIDMAVNTSTMEAREECELSQAAADSAEGGSVEVTTPEVAVEFSPEILSTPAQEEAVPVAEKLPADEVVANDAPGTAGDTESEMSPPVHGEEATVAATDNVASTIQGGSITEEPASVSYIPHEEALEESQTQPVSEGPTPSVDAASTLAVDAPTDIAVNTSTMEARGEGDASQAAADSAEGSSVEVTTPEVAVDIAPEVFSTPAKEEVVAVGEELPADEVVANDAPATAGDTESETSYPVHGEEATVATTDNVVSTIQGGSISEEQASVSDIPKEEALEESQTQPASEGPTPSVDAASTLIVDASIDMVTDTPAMVASEEGEISQAAADSAEGSSVEVVTPEVAVEVAPEIFSTPAQEEVVPVAEELPADVFVTDGAPETAGDTDIQISDPVNGEETTVTATTNITSTIQGGSITEEQASVSDIQQEEASTFHEPLTGGSLAAPAAPVGDKSALVVDHDVDGSTNNAPEELIEVGETRQVVTEDIDDRAAGTPASKVATEAPGLTEDPETEEVSPTAGGETPVAAIRECGESVADPEIDISAPVRGEETPVAAVTDEVPSVAVDGTVVEEPAYDATAEEQEAWVDETAPPTPALNGISAVDISSLGAAEEPEAPKTEAPLADYVSGVTPLSLGEASVPILAVVDAVEVTDTVPGAHGSTEEQPISLASAEEDVSIIPAAEDVDRATADETTPLSAAEGDGTLTVEDELARGVPGDPATLIDDGSLAKYDDAVESADKSADDASTIVGEGGEGQHIEAGMQEGAHVDAATPGVDDHALATEKGTEPDQPIPQEPTSTAAGSDKAEPRTEDAITDVVSRGSISLSDGTSVSAEIGTAEVSVETPLAATTEDVGQRQTVVGAVEGEVAEMPTAEGFESVNAAADTNIDMLAPVRGKEAPVAMVTDKVPSAAVDGTAVEEPCHDATAEEQKPPVDETTAPTAALNETSGVDAASLDVREEQEAPNNEDTLADIVSSDTPLSLGEASAPILDVVDTVEDTAPVSGADESTAEQSISLASAEENVPIVPAAEDPLADTVSWSSTELALGSADEAFRDVPLAATVSKEEVQELPVEMAASGRAEVLITEATGEATTAENGDGVESAPTGGEDAFVSEIEGRAPIVTHGEGIADEHAPFNTEEEEAAPTTNGHLAGTVFGGPAMLGCEAPVIAADGAMDTLQDKTLGNSISGGTADKPVEEQSPEVCVEAPVYADNIEVENRSVLVSDDKPGLNHGEDNSPTALDDANADKPNCEAVGRQPIQEAQEVSTELVETTTEQSAPMLSNGLPTPNAEDTLMNEDVVSVAGAQEAGDVSEAALQAGGVGSGDPDSTVNEAPELISDRADDFPAEQVRGNPTEGDDAQRAVGLTTDGGPVASVEETVPCAETSEQENMVEPAEEVLEPAGITTEGEPLDDMARAETSAGGSILMATESGGIARDAQRAETAAETGGEELMAADGNDLRQEGAQENSSANGVPVDMGVNGTEEQGENATGLEEARSVNTPADELLDEAVPLDTEQCTSSTAQPTDGLDEQPAASTVGGGEEKHAVDCVAEGKTTNTLTPDVIEKDSPMVAESTEGTERPLSSKEDTPGSPPEGENPSFVSGKVAADDPAPGSSAKGEEGPPAPEENQVDCMQAGLTPSANEEVTLAVSEHAEESTETATAAGPPLAEDSLAVAPDETLVVVDQTVSEGTSTAATAAEEIDAEQLVGETPEGKLMDVLIPEAAKVEEASGFSGAGDSVNAINNSAPTDSLDGVVVDVPLDTAELEAEEALVAENNLDRAAVDIPRSSAEQAAAVSLTVDEAVKTSPDEGMPEVADEGKLQQTMAITGEEDSPVATMTPIDTASLGVDIEIPADVTGPLVQNVDEAVAEEAAGEKRVTVLAASETEHLSSDMTEEALINEGIPAASPAAGRQVSIDDSNDAGEGHDIRLEKPISDDAGLRPAPADAVVAADQVKDNPASAPEEERLVAGGEDHPVSPPPPEVVQTADVIVDGDEEACSAKGTLVDGVTQVNVVSPTLDVLAGQDTEPIVAKEEITPPVVLDAPPALEAGVYVPTAGESGSEGAEQTAGTSVENAEVAQPTNLVVEGLVDEATMAANVPMTQEEGLATRVEDYRPEEAVDSGAAAPQMENDADRSGPGSADDGVALEDRGNAVEVAREESAVAVAESLDKTREEAPATPQISDLNVGGGGTLSVDDIVSVGDEGGSVASIAVSEDKVLAAIPGGPLKPTSETIEDGTSEFFLPEGAVVPEPVSMDVNAVGSMGDEGSIVFPAVEAAKQLPIVPYSETAHNEKELAVEHKGVPAHEFVDDAGTLEAGVEQAVPAEEEEKTPVAVFDAVLSNEIHLERLPSGTATFTPTAEENSEEEEVNKTPKPLVVRDEIDHEVDQLVVTTAGDGLKPKDEKVSSSVVELGTGEGEPTSVIGELFETAEVVPVAAEIVHVDNPSSADVDSGTTARNEQPAPSTSGQAQSSTTSEGVGASLAVENVSSTGIGESTPVSVDDKEDVARTEQPQKQAATSTSNESLAGTSDEPAVGLPPGTNVTLEDDEAREKTASAAEREDGGEHTLPNAVMEEQNEGLPADEATGVTGD